MLHDRRDGCTILNDDDGPAPRQPRSIDRTVPLRTSCGQDTSQLLDDAATSGRLLYSADDALAAMMRQTCRRP